MDGQNLNLNNFSQEDYCSSFLCRDGNCEGCRDGKPYCSDPRCAPYCRGCPLPRGMGWVALIVVVIVVLLVIFLLIASFLLIGPRIMRIDVREIQRATSPSFQTSEITLTPSACAVF